MYLDAFYLLFEVLKKGILMWRFHIPNNTEAAERCRLEGSFSCLYHSCRNNQQRCGRDNVMVTTSHFISFSLSTKEHIFPASFIVRSGPCDLVLHSIHRAPCASFHLFHILSPCSRTTFHDWYPLCFNGSTTGWKGLRFLMLTACRTGSQECCLACFGPWCRRDLGIVCYTY